jgi:hypothetical protein
MLQSVKALRGGAIVARDERFGFIVDLYFDDESWRLRYVVLDTGRPMPQRSVLIDPRFIAHIDPADNSMHVSATRKEIEKMPDWTSALPVYLQHDMTPMGHSGDGHLRSSEIAIGCSVQSDRSLGHVIDLLLDTKTLAIATLEVAAHPWLPGKHLSIPPIEVQRIDRVERRLYLHPTYRTFPLESSMR